MIFCHLPNKRKSPNLRTTFQPPEPTEMERGSENLPTGWKSEEPKGRESDDQPSGTNETVMEDAKIPTEEEEERSTLEVAEHETEGGNIGGHNQPPPKG